MTRLPRFGRALAIVLATAAATLSMTQAADAAPATRSAPGSIAVPAGNKLFLVGHGTGFQIYTCNGAAGWSTATPDARLFGDNGQLVATHFAGPTWKALDGSTVKGARIADYTDPTRPPAIPWLLLKADSTTAGPVGNELTDTTYIQRLATRGGLAPAAAKCDTASAGKVARVPYTADYYFWKKDGPRAHGSGFQYPLTQPTTTSAQSSSSSSAQSSGSGFVRRSVRAHH